MGGWEDWLPVALVGRTSAREFVVQFLVNADGGHTEAIDDVRRELDFYLVEKREPDPWVYAQYHCGTAANVYSSVHWSFFVPRSAMLVDKGPAVLVPEIVRFIERTVPTADAIRSLGDQLLSRHVVLRGLKPNRVGRRDC